MRNKDLQNLIQEKMFQYEIITGAYVMEPWEKMTFSKVHDELSLLSINLYYLDVILLVIVSLSVKTLFLFTHKMFGIVS